MAALEEGNVATLDTKNEPVSTNVHASDDLPSSKAPPDSGMANSEVLQENDPPNDEMHPNREQPRSDTQPPSEEANAGTLPNTEEPLSNQPVNTESLPYNQPDNSELPLNNQLVKSEAPFTDQLGNAPALPDNQPVSSEAPLEKQPGPDNTELPLNNQLVSSEAPFTSQLGNAEALPDNQPVSSEASLEKQPGPEVLPGNQLVNSELHMSNGVVMSETQPGNELVISVTQPSNEVVISVTQPSNEVVTSKTQPIDDVVMSETQPSSEVVETQPINEVVTSETQPSSSEVVTSETQSGSEVVVTSETQPSSEVVALDTQPSNEAAASETQPIDDLAASETQPINEVVMSETQPSNELDTSETHPSNEVDMSEAQPIDDVVMSEMQPSREVAQTSSDVAVSETQHTSEVVVSEIQPSSEVVISETQTSSEVVISETQTSSEEPKSETQPSTDVIAPETQPTSEVAMSKMQPRNEVIMSEAPPQDHLANSTTHPNNQLSTSEGFPDNQFADHHMLHENQLHVSEPLPDNQLTDSKPMSDHLVHFDMLPNNHLVHPETLSHNHIANSEALSHDQLGNTQMLSDFEPGNNEILHSNQLVDSQAHYELAPIPSYEIVNASTPLNEEERTPETQPNKRRKKKSIVWEHFTIETVSPGCRRACCKQCKQSFAYSTGSKVAGTSHLKRHIAKGACPALLRNQGPNQLITYTPRSRGGGSASVSDAPKRRYRSPSTPYVTFDQDFCRQEIARMIIMHDYPLHMVEHPGFVAFIQNLQPRFNMVTFNTVQGDCVATYLMEKQNLMRYIDGLPGRVCLTLDMWGSSQSVGYVFITGHFVDNDWKLQKRVLNVVMEPYPDSDSALSHAVAACLSDWNLEGRLFSITTQQASSDIARENLRPLLSVKNPLILNGQLLVGNCIARTLSSVAKDLLESARDIVKKVRDSVKYVKTSEPHEEKFLELKQQLQVPSERTLFIDDQTQWNMTYQMLVAASELKEVFSCLDTSDPDYKGAPSMQDWKLVEILCTYLKPLFDAASILTTTTHPTAITFFHEVWKLQLDLARAVMSEDPFISKLNKIMQEKIDKYWRDCSLVLALAVVMDPRFKMKLVEFSFTKIYGDDAPAYIKVVEDGVHELFHEYVALPLPLTPAYAEEGSGGGNMKMEESPGGTLMTDHSLTDFDVYIMETTSQQMKSELDQYLDESLLPRVPDFDVLGWWKLNRLKYPTLSKMARDILSVPVATVPPDSLFDTKNKEMDQYRSSLRPETVEALVCAKDWLQ